MQSHAVDNRLTYHIVVIELLIIRAGSVEAVSVRLSVHIRPRLDTRRDAKGVVIIDIISEVI